MEKLMVDPAIVGPKRGLKHLKQFHRHLKKQPAEFFFYTLHIDPNQSGGGHAVEPLPLDLAVILL
jgi:hypothetical protein